MKVINQRDRLGRGLVLILLLLHFQASKAWSVGMQEGKQPPPNILLIYVDDLGFGDVGVYGEGPNPLVNTPNIDELASRGMRFTHGYAPAPLCSPSRAAMLTGKNVARVGFEFVTKFNGDTLSLNNPAWKAKHKEFSLLPPPYTLNLPLEEVTLAEVLKERGYSTGLVGKWHVAAHHERYKGWSQTHGPRQQGFDWAVETFGAHPYSQIEVKDVPAGQYPADEVTEKAIEFLNQSHEAPFFLMASFYFVHTPLLKTLPWLYEEIKEKAPVGTPEKLIHYAVNVALMDQYVGQLMQALQLAGLQENTLVVFTSDNGGHPEFANNGNFRGSKWNLYEGGIRIPMLFALPSRIPAGSQSDVPVSQLDFMPTFLDFAGGIAENFQGDGRSLVPLLVQEAVEWKDRAMLWHFPYYHPEGQPFFSAAAEIGIGDGQVSQTRPHSALRWGEFKLIHFYENNSDELYNLILDPSESTDLSRTHVEVKLKLHEKMKEMLTDSNARLPIQNQ